MNNLIHEARKAWQQKSTNKSDNKRFTSNRISLKSLGDKNSLFATQHDDGKGNGVQQKNIIPTVANSVKEHQHIVEKKVVAEKEKQQSNEQLSKQHKHNKLALRNSSESSLSQGSFDYKQKVRHDAGKEYFFAKRIRNSTQLDEHPSRFVSSGYSREILNQWRTKHATYD